MIMLFTYRTLDDKEKRVEEATARLRADEEYIGHNQQKYYDVLAEVGGGAWQPSEVAASQEG